jgi:hypothetical protein
MPRKLRHDLEKPTRKGIPDGKLASCHASRPAGFLAGLLSCWIVGLQARRHASLLASQPSCLLAFTPKPC